jgi:hypothetical protein
MILIILTLSNIESGGADASSQNNVADQPSHIAAKENNVVSIFVYVCVYVYIYVFVYIYIYIYIRIYNMFMHMHMYLRIYTITYHTHKYTGYVEGTVCV